jgi:phage recombination protein Bet
MNTQSQAIVPIRTGALSAPQIDLIKRTVAKDCDANEFDHFMAVAQQLQLDPLRKQICAMVFSKDDAKKRNMSIIVQIDGLRAIANRCGDYRAASSAPLIEYDVSLRGPDNPLGIIRCEVTLWRFAHGAWHPQVGEAYWDEFAPIKDIAEEGWEWVDTGEFWADSGKPKKRKQAKGNGEIVRGVEGNWAKMGRIMIAKCAEAQALRKGWPEQFSGIYVEEEMQRATVIDATASEVLAEHHEQQRRERIGMGEGALFLFEAGGNLIHVERGKIADRLVAYYEREAPSAQAIIDFRQRNEASLKTFWTWAPSEALEVKKIAERRVAELTRAKQTESAGAGGRTTDKDAGREAAESSSGAEPGGEAPPASESAFEALKQECLDCLSAKAPRRALNDWAKKRDAATLTDQERADLDKIEANVREGLTK